MVAKKITCAKGNGKPNSARRRVLKIDLGSSHQDDDGFMVSHLDGDDAEQLGGKMLHTLNRLAWLRGSRVEMTAAAYALIEAGINELVTQAGNVRVRDAAQVLIGGQPGKGDAGARKVLIAEAVRSAVKVHATHQPAPGFTGRAKPATITKVIEATQAHWLACNLNQIDPAFGRLNEAKIAEVLAHYRNAKSKQALIDAVTDLVLLAAPILGIKRGAGLAKERRTKVRDGVRSALAHNSARALNI